VSLAELLGDEGSLELLSCESPDVLDHR